MEVQHSKDKGRFFVSLDGREAELTYRPVDDKTLEFFHTFTPNELRGQGLAGKITQAALLYAQEQGFKVKPTCPYVVAYIERHPEYQSLTL